MIVFLCLCVSVCVCVEKGNSVSDHTFPLRHRGHDLIECPEALLKRMLMNNLFHDVAQMRPNDGPTLATRFLASRRSQEVAGTLHPWSNETKSNDSSSYAISGRVVVTNLIMGHLMEMAYADDATETRGMLLDCEW